MKNCNILIVGVGGQGTLLASRVLGAYGQNAGYDVKLSEVHGMSQRGGSVVTHIKLGDKVYSPIVEEGTADFILAFEELEGYRMAHYLKDGGTMFVNTQEIMPMPVITGKAEYPQNIIDTIKSKGKNIIAIDALTLAREAGSTRAVNTVLIGALMNRFGASLEETESAIEKAVKPSILDINLKAVRLGYGASKEVIK